MYLKLLQSMKGIRPSIYHRKRYFSHLEGFLGSSFIKVITGQRRVGKSYFLYQVMEHLRSKGIEDEIIYINKELDIDNIIKTAHDLESAVEEYKRHYNLGDKKVYLFIDEIQEIEGWERVVRKWRATEQYEIFISGSNSKMLSGELSTFLGGRYVELHIYPFDFFERCEFLNCPPDKNSLEQYLMLGGMPELLSLERSNDRVERDLKFDILKTILESTLLRDVINRYKINNPKVFQGLVQYLALNIGTLFSAKNINNFLDARQMGLSLPTLISYIGYLENSYLVYPVERYDIKGKKVLEFSQKIYFNDLGLRNSFAMKDLQFQSHLLENLVFLHLCMNGWKVYTGKLGEKEIDFIAEKQDQRIYIQVVWALEEQTHDREFANLLSIKDGYKKIVVGFSDSTIGNFQGIEYLSILDFLNKTDLL